MNKKRIRHMTVRELLRKVSNIEEVEAQIKNCSVGLVRIPNGRLPEEADIVGSGTLVKVDEKYGILTAQHVIDPLMSGSGRFGLSIASYEHSFTIGTDDIRVAELPKVTTGADYPDVALVFLLGPKLATLQAVKSFWNLPYHKQRWLSKSWSPDNCLWAISGCPGVLSTEEAPTAHFRAVKAFMNILGYSGVEREYLEGEFDLLELSVLYLPDVDLPYTFGGMSGGGLWQIPVWESDNGIIQAEDPLLWGLACQETKIEEDRRQIICHGPETVYRKLLDRVMQEYSG